MNTHDETFKAMADATRRQILAALCQQSREAGELARLVGLAPNAMSFHLRWLKSVGLVSVRREGRWLWYSVQVQSLRSWLDSLAASFQITGSVTARDVGSRAAAGSGEATVVADRGRAPRSKSGPTRRAGERARGGVSAKGSPTRGGDNVATDTLPDELL